MAPTSTKSPTEDHLLHRLHDALLAINRSEVPEITLRQTAILLFCYGIDSPQTVVGLAATLIIPKEAVINNVNMLVERDLILCEYGLTPHRHLLIRTTSTGRKFCRRMLEHARTVSRP
jgi:DNA-binding MarR family transcriptional regulator